MKPKKSECTQNTIMRLLILCALATLTYAKKNEFDLQAKIDETLSSSVIDWKTYNSPEQVLSYLDTIVSLHRDIAELVDLGMSSNNRKLTMIRISSDLGVEKPIIYVDAGIHGREFVSIPTALYLIRELTHGDSNKHMIEDVEWHIFPLVNPDGYEIALTETTPMWRKTNSRDTQCPGTDLDRNFDIEWGSSGTSPQKCSYIYRGSSAFSEPEGVAIRDHILNHKDRVKLYLSLRSFSTKIHYPWRYKADLPDNHEELEKVAESVSQAIYKVRKTRYTIGNGYEYMYPAGGVIGDWVMQVAGVKLSYTMELPGTTFRLPPNEILPIAIETFEGIKVYHDYVQGEHLISGNSEPGTSTGFSSWWIIGLLFVVAFAGLTGFAYVYYFKTDVIQKLWHKTESTA